MTAKLSQLVEMNSPFLILGDLFLRLWKCGESWCGIRQGSLKLENFPVFSLVIGELIAEKPSKY